MSLYGKHPGVVRSYDANKRTCRVEIEGVTFGGDDLPIAEMQNAIGDRGYGVHSSEIEILPGDLVWLEFIRGNPCRPLITGYRNKHAGNTNGARRWHHDGEIIIHADGDMTLKAANVKIESDTLTHNGVNIGETHKHGKVAVGAAKTDNPE